MQTQRLRARGGLGHTSGRAGAEMGRPGAVSMLFKMLLPQVPPQEPAETDPAPPRPKSMMRVSYAAADPSGLRAVTRSLIDSGPSLHKGLCGAHQEQQLLPTDPSRLLGFPRCPKLSGNLDPALQIFLRVYEASSLPKLKGMTCKRPLTVTSWDQNKGCLLPSAISPCGKEALWERWVPEMCVCGLISHVRGWAVPTVSDWSEGP